MILDGGQFFGGSGAVAGAAAASALVGSCNAEGGFDEVEVAVAGGGATSQLVVTTFFLVCDFFVVAAGCGFVDEDGFVTVLDLEDWGCVVVGVGV